MPLIWTIYCFQGFTNTMVAFISSSILIFQVPQWRRSSCLSAVPGLPGQATDLLQQHSQPNGRIQSGNFNLKSSTIAKKLPHINEPNRMLLLNGGTAPLNPCSHRRGPTPLTDDQKLKYTDSENTWKLKYDCCQSVQQANFSCDSSLTLTAVGSGGCYLCRISRIGWIMLN